MLSAILRYFEWKQKKNERQKKESNRIYCRSLSITPFIMPTIRNGRCRTDWKMWFVRSFLSFGQNMNYMELLTIFLHFNWMWPHSSGFASDPIDLFLSLSRSIIAINNKIDVARWASRTHTHTHLIGSFARFRKMIIWLSCSVDILKLSFQSFQLRVFASTQ